MKTFMVSSALFILLMFFPVQWGIEMYNTNLRENVDLITDKYAQQARIDGRFTAASITSMKNEIHSKLNIPIDQIEVNATQIPKYREDMFNDQEFINYEVKVPIPRILAMTSYFGISDEDNKAVYVRAGSVASEVLAP